MSYWSSIGDSDIHDTHGHYELDVAEDRLGGYNPDPSGAVRLLVMPTAEDGITLDIHLAPDVSLELARRLIEGAHATDPSLTITGSVVPDVDMEAPRPLILLADTNVRLTDAEFTELQRRWDAVAHGTPGAAIKDQP